MVKRTVLVETPEVSLKLVNVLISDEMVDVSELKADVKLGLTICIVWPLEEMEMLGSRKRPSASS